MIRTFCIGAFVGFLFGSSKAGIERRNQLNGFFNDLLKSDRVEDIEDKRDEDGDFEYAGRVSRSAIRKNGDAAKQDGTPGRSERPGRGESAPAVVDVPERAAKPKKSERAPEIADTAPVKAEKNEKVPERSAANEEEAKAKEDDATKSGEAGISPNKAHELADKLSAKPSQPPHEELEPS